MTTPLQQAAGVALALTILFVALRIAYPKQQLKIAAMLMAALATPLTWLALTQQLAPAKHIQWLPLLILVDYGETGALIIDPVQATLLYLIAEATAALKAKLKNRQQDRPAITNTELPR